MPPPQIVEARGIHGDKSHQAVSSYFIGPQAENLDDFRANIESILNELKNARLNYFPNDPVFITEEIQNTDVFKSCREKVAAAVTTAARLLGKHSLPFWSPRYQAHMCMDLSMPALLGYFMTMIYNPNNVALEASPLTTVAEIECGNQLCEMFGYNVTPEKTDGPIGWGHITCGGTVANLESIWVARNLKFYPLSIFKAMEKDGSLDFISHSFEIKTCQGEKKLFSKLNSWELLNLKPTDILDIPQRLTREYGISPTYMEKVLKECSIQETGKDALVKSFGIKEPQYMMSTTRHYSWPKGAAIAGIGAKNVIGIPVDHGARLDIKKLEEQLKNSLTAEQAVYAVVVIIGSTEEGCVDRLSEVIALREKYQELGLSFLIHADAAWGGYFANMLPPMPDKFIMPIDSGGDRASGEGFVPDSALRTETQQDLLHLRFADSITVDPHKAGYIPYPAGGLCYRDERMRFLVTWTSPYLSRGAVTSMGIYGVEGSKPGAAAMSTWLSNTCIGLGPDGYGALLGEVTFTCSRFSAEWAAMTTPDMDFRVVPLNMLPSELKDLPNPDLPDNEKQKAREAMVEKEKKRIRENILEKTNTEIVNSDAENPEDDKIMTLLRALGSDLNINAFALNFRLTPDGEWNEDVGEANYLMSKVIEKLSVDSPSDNPDKLKLVLTSTQFSDELYGECAANFKRRLGLKNDKRDLMVLRNVVMNPFPSENKFIGDLAEVFKETVAIEVEECQKRNSKAPTKHTLLLQGTETLYMIHIPTFHTANHRQQVIVEIEIDAKSKKQYLDFKKANPTLAMFLVTNKIRLPDHLQPSSTFSAQILDEKSMEKLNDPEIIAPRVARNVDLTVKKLVKSRPLNSVNLDQNYPKDFTPFYLYGNKKERNIDHMLLRSPNAQLSAEGVEIKLDKDYELSDADLSDGLLLCVQEHREAPSQPFPSNADLQASSNFWFRPENKLQVKIYKDEKAANAEGPGLTSKCDSEHLLATGHVTLGKTVYIDTESMNEDPLKKPKKVAEWIEEFRQIGKSMDLVPRHV